MRPTGGRLGAEKPAIALCTSGGGFIPKRLPKKKKGKKKGQAIASVETEAH